MIRKLSPSESTFVVATVLYSITCFAFAFWFDRGTEVVFLSAHYSNQLNAIFSIITKIAEWQGIVAFGIIILLSKRKRFFPFALASLLTFVAILLLKQLVFASTVRPRAWAQSQAISLPEHASALMQFSFPSGHTAFAFCMMYCLTLLFGHKWLTVLFWSLAFAVALSRIYLMAHFVIDTGIGALIGLSFGILGNRFFERYLAGTTHPNPR